MKAIALLQPWATLVVTGRKLFETRSWPTSYRGPLLIHASKRFPRELQELCLTPPFATALAEVGYEDTSQLPLGGIIGSVLLAACNPIVERPQFGRPDDMGQPEEPELSFGDYTPGRYAWTLTIPDNHDLIPYKGSLGIFEVDFLKHYADVLRDMAASP